MRALSLVLSFSLLLIPISLVSLGATAVIVHEQQKTIEELTTSNNLLVAKIEELNGTIRLLNQKLAETQHANVIQAVLLDRKEAELMAAVATSDELRTKIRSLEAKMAAIKLAQVAAPLIAFLPLGSLMAMYTNTHKKAVHSESSKDMNIVIVRMTRDQAREYSKWRRNEKR